MALVVTVIAGIIIGVLHFVDSLKRCKACDKKYKDWETAINPYDNICYNCYDDFNDWLKSPQAAKMFNDGRLKL